MFVTKRNGQVEPVQFDKITTRISRLCPGLNMTFVDPVRVAQKVIDGIYNGVTTAELDNLAAETAAGLSTTHPDYSRLAARIAVSRLHKETETDYLTLCQALYKYVNPRTQEAAPLISPELLAVVILNKDRIQAALDYGRDFAYDYFGYKTLERSYLLRMQGKPAERPQHLLMRVSLGIHGTDIDSALTTYELMSDRWFTHATPTLFNAGTLKPQMSSCFLLDMQDDSIHGIYQTLMNCALISQGAGGLGLAVSKVRATGSYIKGTNGTSNGLIPMLKVFNDTARYVDQGGGKRKGALAIYIEPWHGDIFDVLELRKNNGKEELRARDLFLALWTPDIFMQRVETNGDWTLMCPNECPGLTDTWGDAFDELYLKYEREGRGLRTIKAQELWNHILECQTETGNPFMLFKDHANGKSNQQNLGTIKSSNLCTEIIEYTDPGEIAVCNLASLALPRFVTTMSYGDSYNDPFVNEPTLNKFDHQKLYEVAYQATLNLNKVIDCNHYPLAEARTSNLRHRPIGLGVQGLADVYMLLRLPFESDAARQLNQDIFETIYFAAMTASKDLAIKRQTEILNAGDYDMSVEYPGAYETFAGSPLSKGQFQFDLWSGPTKHSGRWDWEALRTEVITYGVRNSLLLAPMPTASTAQILGNNEAFEPYTSNIYVRRVLSGEFVQVNNHLVRELIALDLWNPTMKDQIVQANGSVQNISELPEWLRKVYKTVWEIPQRRIIDMAAERGRYVCQSQSLNIHMLNPTPNKLTSLHFHAWKSGLKTGMYYLRTKAAVDAVKVTMAVTRAVPKTFTAEETLACSIDNPDACEACGS